MDLGTFGAVLKHALGLEDQAGVFYGEAAKAVIGSDASEVYKSLHERALKRVAVLERIRRENTTEMILEPISGLDSDDHMPVTSPVPSSHADLAEMAKGLERELSRFYANAAEKVEFLIEAADAFERLGDENLDNLDRLNATD